MPKRKGKPTPETVAAQKQRFIEKAKELGVDELAGSLSGCFGRWFPPRAASGLPDSQAHQLVLVIPR